jgi:hypothetical protein
VESYVSGQHEFAQKSAGEPEVKSHRVQTGPTSTLIERDEEQVVGQRYLIVSPYANGHRLPSPLVLDQQKQGSVPIDHQQHEE